MEFNDTPIDNENNHVFDDSIELLTFIQVLFRNNKTQEESDLPKYRIKCVLVP